MHTAESLLLILLVVALSDIVNRMVAQRAPVPILQIVGGILLAGLGVDSQVPLSPELFFFLILSPLLYAEALRLSPHDMYRDRKRLLGMAVGLVFVTVFAVGFFIHWLLPEIPLAVACALGAVLAPTDAVAVAAFTGKLAVPDRLSKLLNSESLLNDASGVAALSVAVAAVMTGHFSIGSATLSFLRLAIGGVFFGVVVGLLGAKLIVRLTQQCDEDPASQVVLGLMLPFASFMAAEVFHTSGILAAVATGLIFNTMAQSRLSSRRSEWGKTSWHMVEFSLNGLIFVMLGLQLPGQLGRVPEGLEPSFLHLFLYPIFIVLLLMAIRFVWSELLLRLTVFRSRVAGKPAKHPGLHWLTVNTLAGARGTISLAAALSIPVALDNGSAFPGREVILYYSTAVVFLTLGAAAIGLPLLVPKMEPAPPPSPEELDIPEEELDAPTADEPAVSLEELEEPEELESPQEKEG